MKKKLIATMAMLTLSLAITACGAKKTETAGKEEEKTLVMATNAEFSPYEYHEKQEIVGIDVDIAKAIAEKMGRKLVIEDMAFDSILVAVQTGKADMAVAALTARPDRMESVDFSDSYTTSAQVIIVAEGSSVSDPEDLTGKTIGVQLATTGDYYAGDIKDAVVERYNKGAEAVQALVSGKIDAVIIDREPAKVFVKKNEGLRIIDKEFTIENYAIAVAKGNTDLVTSINQALVELKEEGKLKEIEERYINAEE